MCVYIYICAWLSKCKVIRCRHHVSHDRSLSHVIPDVLGPSSSKIYMLVIFFFFFCFLLSQLFYFLSTYIVVSFFLLLLYTLFLIRCSYSYSIICTYSSFSVSKRQNIFTKLKYTNPDFCTYKFIFFFLIKNIKVFFLYTLTR